MKIKIPKTIKIIGKIYSVIFEDDLEYSNSAWGETRYKKSQIAIQKSVKGNKIPQQEIEHTFIHELLHAILREMGEDKLKNNEKFVDLFANIFYQVLKENSFLGKEKHEKV